MENIDNQVLHARNEFIELWKSLRSMPFNAAFDGSVSDIIALDYLDYESIKYPAGGIEAASLVWGNVLVQQAGFKWKQLDARNLFLEIKYTGFTFAIWPYARVFESQHRSCPQDGKYRHLSSFIISECLADDWIPNHWELRLRELARQIESAS